MSTPRTVIVKMSRRRRKDGAAVAAVPPPPPTQVMGAFPSTMNFVGEVVVGNRVAKGGGRTYRHRLGAIGRVSGGQHGCEGRDCQNGFFHLSISIA